MNFKKVKLYGLTYLKYLLHYFSIAATAFISGIMTIWATKSIGLSHLVLHYFAIVLTGVFLMFGLLIKDVSSKYELTPSYFRTALTLLFIIDASKYSDALINNLLGHVVWLVLIIIFSWFFNKKFEKFSYKLLDFTTLEIDFIEEEDEIETALHLKDSISNSITKDIRDCIFVQASVRRKNIDGKYGNTIRFNLIQPLFTKQIHIKLFDTTINYTLATKEN